MLVVPASIPSPSQGAWHLGPFPVRGYALCIIAGIVAAVFDHRPAVPGPRRAAGPGRRRRGLGGSLRHRRRAHLPRHHELAAVLRSGRPPARRASRSGRAASASGARSRSGRSGPGSAAAGRASCCRRSPTPSLPGSPSRRRSAGGATGSTRSCSAGRRRCRGGCGSTRRTARRATSSSHLPPDVPLRVAVVHRRGPRRGLGRPPVPARPRPGLSPVRRALHRRPVLDRAPAHRRRQPHPRPAGEHLGLDAGLRRRVVAFIVSARTRPGRETPAELLRDPAPAPPDEESDVGTAPAESTADPRPTPGSGATSEP